MSKLILPLSCRPAQIEEKQRVCVIVHSKTKRILCFAKDDWFADSFVQKGYEKIQINHAHEYDMYARRIREQSKTENEAEDYAYLERENVVRKRLRAQLEEVIRSRHSGNPDKKAAEDALRCLQAMENKRKRIRDESFMVQEAYEETKNPGEELISKLMVPKK